MGRLNDKLHPRIPSLNKEKGFTLVELLIVIAVLGVLAGVLIIAINPAAQMRKARDTKRKANVAQIQHGIELYRSDRGTYPEQSRLSSCGSSLIEGSVTYISNIPCDPTGGAYVYDSTPDTGTAIYTYSVRACLENVNDPERDSGTSPCAPRVGYTRTQP